MNQLPAAKLLITRYLLPKKGNLLALALWLSVVGVMIGAAQLVVVLSVMSGFQDLLRRNFTRISSEVVVLPKGRMAPSPEFRTNIKSTAGVAAVTPFALGAGMVVFNGRVGGVVLEGIDKETTGSVTPWNEILIERDEGKEKGNAYWIWLGHQLARKLNIRVGDSISLLIGDEQGKKVLPFVVTGLFRFGIYDHDLHWARVDMNVLDQVFRKEPEEKMYKILVDKGVSIEGTGERLRENLKGKASVRLWSEINQNIFLAVEHQKQLLFLVLEIVLALAAVNVVNLLLMSGYHRRKDIAILRAMGIKFSTIIVFFLVQGTFVGVVGAAFGLGLGWILCRMLEQFQPAILSESIYNVTRLPLKTLPMDLFLVAIGAIVVCIVFSLVPAMRAAQSSPAEALKYE